MIEEACVAIEHVEQRERRAREIKYGRRNKIRYIDKLLNELEMLNLADQTAVPERLAIELERLMAESAVVELVEQPRPESVAQAMDVLYEIQDSLMINEADDD
jgi:predicted metal-dependent TIM-barrel fold hydrolase